MFHKCCYLLQVGVHGSGLANGFFLAPGSALVEILSFQFAVIGVPNGYFQASLHLPMR